MVNDNNEHKKAKDVNRNVVGTISHNVYRDASWNKKCLRRSMNRIQSENHKIGTCEENRISVLF